ncbi:hypothetical protein Bbelb_354830 [Branchiostoma belcheri]|nr:hypothetical protein Bbelb_354830 [Branchiostoma belcheri]
MSVWHGIRVEDWLRRERGAVLPSGGPLRIAALSAVRGGQGTDMCRTFCGRVQDAVRDFPRESAGRPPGECDTFCGRVRYVQRESADNMGWKLRHLLIFLLLILKEPNLPEGCVHTCTPYPEICRCAAFHLTNIPKNLPFYVSTSNSHPVLHNTNTRAVAAASGLDHQYEDVGQHDQTGQGQSQAISKSNTNTNTTAVVVTSGIDHQYEDVDQHDQTRQGQTITKSNTNTTAVVVTSGNDHRYEDMNHHVTTRHSQSQAITKSNTNTKANVMASGDDHKHEYMNLHVHNQTRQGQSQGITKSNANTTAVVATTGHDHKHEYLNLHNQTGQGQSQAITKSNTNTTADDYCSQTEYQVITEPLDTKSQLYNTEPTASNSTTKSMYTKLYNQTGQGQSQAITESNTNTTATEVASGDDQTGQGQSQAITESNTNTTATVVASVGLHQKADRALVQGSPDIWRLHIPPNMSDFPQRLQKFTEALKGLVQNYPKVTVWDRRRLWRRNPNCKLLCA